MAFSTPRYPLEASAARSLFLVACSNGGLANLIHISV